MAKAEDEASLIFLSMATTFGQFGSNNTFDSVWTSLFEHSPLGCSLLDRDGRIVCATRSFADILEVNVTDLFGKSIFDLLKWSDDFEPSDKLVDGVTMRILTQPEGRACLWTTQRIGEGDALAGYHLGVLCKEGVMERHESRLFHHDRLAFLGSLTAEVTHEMASPLAAIVNSAELLIDESAMEPESLQALAQIRDEAHRLGGLIHDVLSFAHNGPLSIKQQNVVALVEKSAALLTRQCLDNRISLRIEADAELSPVAADAESMQQVFCNLIKNACDASPSNSEILVEIMQSDAEVIEIAITDRGEGIPPADLDNAFRPFFSTKPAGKGTGLGLPIASRIVTAHNGKLQLKSVHGEGTRAIVSLPVWRNGRQLNE